ncbi:hybrid sensor histidine kinase/response regulator [Pseudotamlana agarivorans]|uniref:hybrid sensor histidine kinase/response regulator n=1 Tax=Pseudotamlana agarivorans TaxID=481183 RepID=UPI00082B97A0|nr:ATP-binding protein [Tamlana agarivorans]
MTQPLRTLNFKELLQKTSFRLAMNVYIAAILFNLYYAYLSYKNGYIESFILMLLPLLGFSLSIYAFVVKRNYLFGPYFVFVCLGSATLGLTYLEGIMAGYYWFQFGLLFSLPYVIRREVYFKKHTSTLYAIILAFILLTFLVSPMYSEYYKDLTEEQIHYRFMLNSAVNFGVMMVFSLQALSYNKSVINKISFDKINAESEKDRRTRVLSNLGHELRTQINSINGVTKLILDNESEEVKNKRYFEILDHCNNNMLLLVNDMLDMHKIESGLFELSYEPKVLFDFLSKITVPFINKAEEKNLELHSYIDPKLKDLVVNIDEKRLAQVIYNLISNAIKFTEQGSITFSAQINNTEEDKVSIQFMVQDTGMGIAPKNLKKVFESFHQIKNEKNPVYGGTGLGLSISQSIIKAMGSEIQIESVLKKGTRFQFPLNLERGILTSKTSKFEDAFNDDFLLKLNVLLVEDNMVSMMYAKKLLEKHVLKIHEANNGIEAIESIKEHKKINLVLLDLEMPKMNGFKAIKHIKKLRPNINVVAFTANIPSTEFISKLDSLGFDDILSKPFSKQDLFEILKNYSKEAVS